MNGCGSVKNGVSVNIKRMLIRLTTIVLITLTSILAGCINTPTKPTPCHAIKPTDLYFYRAEGVCTSDDDFTALMQYVRALEFCVE